MVKIQNDWPIFMALLLFGMIFNGMVVFYLIKMDHLIDGWNQIYNFVPFVLVVTLFLCGEVKNYKLAKNATKIKPPIEGNRTLLSRSKREPVLVFISLIYLYSMIFQDVIHAIKDITTILFSNFAFHSNHSHERMILIDMSWIIFALVSLSITFWAMDRPKTLAILSGMEDRIYSASHASKNSLRSIYIEGSKLSLESMSIHLYRIMLKCTISIITHLISYDESISKNHYDTVIENIGVIFSSIFVLVLSIWVLKEAINRINLSTDEHNTTQIITTHLERMDVDGKIYVKDINVVKLENGLYFANLHAKFSDMKCFFDARSIIVNFFHTNKMLVYLQPHF